MGMTSAYHISYHKQIGILGHGSNLRPGRLQAISLSSTLFILHMEVLKAKGNLLRPPRRVHRAHLHQAYKPCFIRAVPPHKFVMTLLK